MPLTRWSVVVATLAMVGGIMVASPGVAAAKSMKSWSVVADPYPSSLSAVSCTGRSSCVAVSGESGEAWSGTGWSLMPGAKPQGQTTCRV